MNGSNGAPADGASHRRVGRPTQRVLLLVAILLVGGGFLAAGVLRTPTVPSGLIVPWWSLAILFAATEIWVFHIQIGREAKSISISEIPLVIGLFYASPQGLLLGRIIGPALIVLLYRRQTALKAALNITLFFANSALALATFRLLSGRMVEDTPRAWLAAVVAATLAIVVDLLVLNLILGWYGDRRGSGGRGFLIGAGIAAASSTVGVVAVLTLRLGPLAALPLLAAGAVLMFGYRAYSTLADRHTSLEQLFQFSRELNEAPATTDVLPAVLEQARELLRAEVAEVLRFTGEATGDVWRFDGEQLTRPPARRNRELQVLLRQLVSTESAVLVTAGSPAAVAFLEWRDAHEAVVAALRVEGEIVGVLAVYDRMGEVRGFADSDVGLLQTVATHASVALYNEMLIGRLRHDALHDALTGLPNRAQLTALATSAVSRATTSSSRVAMMIIDLNGFKVVNDTLGHQVGDQLICEVARRFEAAAAAHVTVGRLGGDEFAVLVEPVEGDGLDVARAMTATFEEPIQIGQERLQLSGSIGVAIAPDHANAVGDLLKRADIAMYAAKNSGETTVVYRPDIDVNDPSLLSLMGELRAALGSGEIRIEVEPVMDLATGQVVGAEALVRWHHPIRGSINPSLFLPLAERNGLIVPLTALVLDQAVAACAAWHKAGLPITIAVNLSTRSLLDRSLPITVAETLRRHHLPAEFLTLEITESIVITDADRALGLLAELRALGVRLALDDFGTGYSSLTYLSALPIQQLKIDRSFVTAILESSRDAAIVTSLIDLAHHLGLEVIAEGVEDEVVGARLRRLGCEYGQGFYFSHSMDPALLPAWSLAPPSLQTQAGLRTRVSSIVP